MYVDVVDVGYGADARVQGRVFVSSVAVRPRLGNHCKAHVFLKKKASDRSNMYTVTHRVLTV